MSDLVTLADDFATRLEAELRHVPDGFLDSFKYTTTGNNLAHPLVWGAMTRVAWGLPEVGFVGVDVRLNVGRRVKFQPDIVAFDHGLNHLLFVDYESPNSSDARVPAKDIDAYRSWQQKTGREVPYLVVTTLPDRESPAWELRYTSPSYYNEKFHGRRSEIAQNPFRFWYAYYQEQFGHRRMDNIAFLNICGRQVSRVYPERAASSPCR